MHILISNDDGYFSAGIKLLREALEKTQHKVSMIAPKENNSACGMSITVREFVDVEKLDDRGYVVEGTPVDCVGLGLGGFLNDPVDIVVSGINNGANLGDDVLYSGTVAAAVEARRLLKPNIAISVTNENPKYYDTAIQVLLDVIEKLDGGSFDDEVALLNINVPDVPFHALKGVRVTRLSERRSPEIPFIEKISSTKWKAKLGGVGEFVMRDGKHEYYYDCESVAEGYASVTPIRAKYSDTPYLDDVAQTLFNGLNK